VVIDTLLTFAAACAWATVLWFYGRAEYREPRWRFLILLTLACTALFWWPWYGWLVAAGVHQFVLQKGFDFPSKGAWTMTVSMLAIYAAVRLLFAFAGPPPPPV